MPNCNVPGCNNPLGAYGVWCSQHYEAIQEDSDA